MNSGVSPLLKKNQMELYLKNIIIKDRLRSAEEELIQSVMLSGAETTYKGRSCIVPTLEQELSKEVFPFGMLHDDTNSFPKIFG